MNFYWRFYSPFSVLFLGFYKPLSKEKTNAFIALEKNTFGTGSAGDKHVDNGCSNFTLNVPVTGVLLQKKSKLLYERLFPDATTPFHPVQDFADDLDCQS